MLLFPDEGEFHKEANDFIDKAIARYWSEDERMEAWTPFLERCFGSTLEEQYEVEQVCRSDEQNITEASTTRFEGAFVTSIESDRGTEITRGIIEFQKHMGDALTQLTKDYAEGVYLFKVRIAMPHSMYLYS